MNVLTAMEKRKSVRAYKPGKVEQEKLDTLVEAANSAPIFGEIHITVVENSSLLNEINDAALKQMKNSGNDFLVKRASMEGYNPLYGAPVLILLSAPNGNDSNGSNMANVSCAAENILIAATELELGSCYVMAPLLALSDHDLFQRMNIPQGYVPLCGVLVGYADVANTAFTHERPKKENVTYLR